MHDHAGPSTARKANLGQLIKTLNYTYGRFDQLQQRDDSLNVKRIVGNRSTIN